MRLPGEALLEFRIEPPVRLIAYCEQVALFKPRGISGLAYWYAVLPLHGIVFRGMLAGIEREAKQIYGKTKSPKCSRRSPPNKLTPG